MKSWSAVTVGVGDLDAALALWVEMFGFEVVASRHGPDPGLAALWQLEPEAIVRQALVRTPGVDAGMIHFVEFDDPDPPVRQGADVFDRVPKNLDVYVDDMPRRIADLRAAGLTFRNDDYSEVTAPNGITFREIHMPAHDAINVVLLEVIGQQHPYSRQGFAGVGPLITIVGDAEAEKRFYRDVIGLEILSDNILDGPEIERMVGLPPGAALDVSILGATGQHFGQMEVIDYRGVGGKNLYPRARPKALGILQIGYAASDLQVFSRQLSALGIDAIRHDAVATLLGSGPVVTVYSPAGLRIDVRQRADE